MQKSSPHSEPRPVQDEGIKISTEQSLTEGYLLLFHSAAEET